MRRTRTFLSFVLAIVLLLLLVIAIALVFIVRSPYPRTDGTIDVAGLQAPVTVQRDELGVAHIYAQNDHDLFFAQGYTHAQDRFWQMEFWRHIGQGRISEIVGPATLETDKFIRNVGWNRMAQEAADNYEQNYPEIYTHLESYSAGVNAWIDENKEDISFNQTVLSLSAGEWEIEPWQPLHTVAWGIVMAWDLRGSANVGSEQSLAEIEALIGRELADIVQPLYPDNRPVIVPTGSDQSSVTSKQLTVDSDQSGSVFRPSSLPTIGSVPESGFALGNGSLVGSNNWVVAGEHTVSGKPLLANDPHLGVQLPSIWYWNGLHAPGWDVAGMSFAGVPGVIVGHNNDIAWGVTNMAADTQDAYIEKINPDNQLQYEFEGEWRNMDVIREEIKVNGGETVVLEVLTTVHGPILNTVDEKIEEVLSIRWSAFEPSRIFAAIIELNRAANYTDFREALSLWDTSGQNVVYADTEGNIAYQSTGRYPLRRGWDGLRPVAGWTGEFEWDGFIPYDEMPRLLNPEKGYIVTANNAIVDDEYPYYLAYDWASGDRAQRIEDMVVAGIESGGVSAEIYQTILNDNYNLLIDSYQPLFRGLSSDDALTQEAIERLRGWDGQLNAESVPATIFEAFLWKLATNILSDELGAEASDLVLNNSSEMRVFLHEIAGNASDVLWDNVETDSAETQQQIIQRAVEDAVTFLSDELGNDSDQWQWGETHSITFRSNPLGESGIAPLERLVNRGPFPVGGGNGSVNANSFGWGDSFASVRSNPSMRMVIDLGNFDDSLAIHPTGQSGHPYHRHYDDMIPLWVNGDLHPFAFSTAKVDELSTQTLTLEPR